MILNSCEYRKINANCPVINIHETDGYVNVKVPHNLHGFKLYDILDVSESPVKTVSFKGVKFDCFHPWVDIPWKNLNKVAGYHVYKLSFMNLSINRFVTTYISYIIQDENTQKDYIYMKDRYKELNEDKYGIYV